MQKIIPHRLLSLAKRCPVPLYVVGGSVRDFLVGVQAERVDWDVCAPLSAETFASLAKDEGFSVRAVYKNTGTVKLTDPDGAEYEYSCFRSDRYVRGVHVPVEIYFTDDIALDARRRDFTANAVYFHLQTGEFVDPLGGIEDIRKKQLRTVAPADKVFGEDGLRLLRLARQSAQLGFLPDNECLQGAKTNAALVDDITPERLYAELIALLHADKRYGNADGAYQGLRCLRETGVLARILPELALGDGMAQRADFHKYDVLEHSFRAVKYADDSVRLAALLHDVGKPFCKLRDGNAHEHPVEGERIAREILCRWKAPKKTVEEVCALVRWHMQDFDCQMKENKLRRFFVEHFELLDKLLLLKQADFSACTDDLSPAPTCVKWRELLERLKRENAPLTLKALAVNGKDLQTIGIPNERIAHTLHALLLHAVTSPRENEKTRLLRLAIPFSEQT